MAFHSKEQHRWLQLKGLFKEIRNVASIDELQVKLRRIFEQAGHVVEDLEDYECYGKENNFWPFSGLGIYLTKFATQEERKDFFNQILPQIAILAEDLVSYLNDRKISLERKGNDLEISYYAVAGLLACGFLCAFPFSTNDTLLRKHNFAEYFGTFHRQSDQVDPASKLRSVLQYFQRLSVHNNLWNTSNVKFTRKDIHYDQLPDLETWLLNQSPLCPVKVDSKNGITDSCGDVMELNFVSYYTEEGFGIKEDYEQNDLSTHLYPELLVAEWILQDVRENEAIIVKKDDWSDIHVAITGVGIRPRHVHNLRRNICNELNRTWVGLSSYTSKFNEKVQSSEENLENNYNVSVTQSNDSLLPRESTQNSEKVVNQVLYTSAANERNEQEVQTRGTNRISEAKTFVNDYSEFVSKSIVKHAIINASWKLHLSKKCNNNVHEADEQTHSPPSCQRDERIVTDGLINCNNDSHCRSLKPVSSGESTYGDLLIKSLVSSINGAVSLTNDITALVSDQRISVALHCENGLRKELELIKKLGKHASVSTSSDMDDSNNFFHARPSLNFQALGMNGDFPDDTEDISNKAPEVTQDSYSWMEMMAFNLAQSITQSAVVFASKCLSPGVENKLSNTISTNVCQINEPAPCTEKHNLPALNGNSSSIVAVDTIDDIKCSADVEIEVVSENSRGRKTSLEAKDCTMSKTRGLSTSEDNSTKAFDKSGLPRSLHYSALDVFAERMSSRILSGVMECQHINGTDDEPRSLPIHGMGCHIPTEENVQLQMAIQWIVASAMECPCLICYAKEETESRKIAWISDRAHRNGWLVSDIVQCILEYYQTKLKNHTHNQSHLFDFLQSTINEPKC